MTFKALSLTLFIFLISGSSRAEYETINGVFDLSSFNFNTGAASISGEWEFYHQLLTPHDLSSPGLMAAFTHVPNAWTDSKGDILQGYGTYRLRILLPKEGSDNLVLF